MLCDRVEYCTANINTVPCLAAAWFFFYANTSAKYLTLLISQKHFRKDSQKGTSLLICVGHLGKTLLCTFGNLSVTGSLENTV